MLRLLLLVALCTTGCTSSPSSAPPAPPDFALAISEGGGFAGGWTGVEVTARGTMTTWSGTGASRTTTAVDTLAASAVDALWARLDPAFFALDADDPGNLTVRIEATGGGRTHAAAWSPGDAPALDSLHADLRALLPR